MPKSPSEVQTVAHATDVLNLFTIERPELGMMEVSRLLGISKSSAHRLVTTLAVAGYLRQHPVTQRYMLGFKVLDLARVLLASLKFRAQAQPWMEWLRAETRETISLYVAEGAERICIERLESTQDIRRVVEINARLPLHSGAAGKVLLAYQPAPVRVRLIGQWQAGSVSSPLLATDSLEAIEMKLTRIREQGYAVSYGERMADAAAIAAPLFDYYGEVIAAITISGPLFRFREEDVAQWIPLVRRAARAISEQMGYRYAGQDGQDETARDEVIRLAGQDRWQS